MAERMKMAVVWVVALCSLVEVYQCFICTCCLMEAGEVQWLFIERGGCVNVMGGKR
jgi:hypothetical protein